MANKISINDVLRTLDKNCLKTDWRRVSSRNIAEVSVSLTDLMNALRGGPIFIATDTTIKLKIKILVSMKILRKKAYSDQYIVDLAKIKSEVPEFSAIPYVGDGLTHGEERAKGECE